jgi:hypothetical protein
MQTYKLAKYTVSQYIIHDIAEYIMCIFRDITIKKNKEVLYDLYCLDIAYFYGSPSPHSFHSCTNFRIYRGSKRLDGIYCDACRKSNTYKIIRLDLYVGPTFFYHILYCIACFDIAYDIDGTISHKIIMNKSSTYYLATLDGILLAIKN